jgi:hypothetical protein
MLWQGAKWRILKNFNVQNEECHNYGKYTSIWDPLDLAKGSLMWEKRYKVPSQDH